MKADQAKKKKESFEFEAALEKSDNRLWGCHFRVPMNIANKLIDGKSRRVVCRLNGTIEYQCAIMPQKNDSLVITVNRSIQQQLGLSVGDPVQVRLTKDRSKYGLPIPEEFAELLRQDTEGERLFHSLTAGKQRTLLYIVGAGKGTDKRIYRSLVVVRHLKANGGIINYKKLTSSLKQERS